MGPQSKDRIMCAFPFPLLQNVVLMQLPQPLAPSCPVRVIGALPFYSAEGVPSTFYFIGTPSVLQNSNLVPIGWPLCRRVCCVVAARALQRVQRYGETAFE